MNYIRRLVDLEIDKKSKAFNALSIVGPKGCGKTRTAKERCKSIIEFQDEEKRSNYLLLAEVSPTAFLKNETPILFDEWQDAPQIWNAIRKDCDDHSDSVGSYYLTSSTSKHVETHHTGTGRISEILMYPMSLFETGESNGKISFYELMTNSEYSIDGIFSSLTLSQLFFAACRGGWPRCFSLSSNQSQLEIARDYYHQIITKDIQNIDHVARNTELARTLLWSYARNMGTLATKKNIYQDVKANHTVSDVTLASYWEALNGLYVIKELDAWTPQIRTKTAIRASKKHLFVDPSIGISALGLSPDYFYQDLDFFGHVFENLVIRDLLVYAQAHDARILHYSDQFGMEADAVYQLPDGRYALIEIKLGTNAIPNAEKNLLKFKETIQKHNQNARADTEHPGVLYREPSMLLIICGTATMAFTTQNGVKVVPVGCLKD